MFSLNYQTVEDCLPLLCQLHRASTLATVEQTTMVCTSVYLHQANQGRSCRRQWLYKHSLTLQIRNKWVQINLVVYNNNVTWEFTKSSSSSPIKG